MKSRFTGKDPAAGKGCRQEENGAGDEMVGCHHWLSGHEFEQTPGVSEGQGSPACCSPLGRKESDTAERLNNCNRDLEVGGSKREIKPMQVGKSGGSKSTWTSNDRGSGTSNPLREN